MLFRAFGLVLFLSCTCVSALAEELFPDLGLERGLNLSAVTSDAKPLILGPVLQVETTEAPLWRLAQWGTRFNLEGASPVRGEDGTRVMENTAKGIVIHPGGLGGDGVTLTVLGGVEYDGGLREKGEAWPHLLVEHRFIKSFRFADYSTMKFSLDFKVLRCVVATDKAVMPDLHTGQINAFFTIHNKNKESADFNDMIWFGLPIFDARFELPPGHQAVDRGKDDATGKFICTLSGSQFYDRPTGDGEWHTLRGDLVPLVKEALAASQVKGFLVNTKFEDLEPTSFNLGWEVPGPYDCEIILKGLSLKGEG